MKAVLKVITVVVVLLTALPACRTVEMRPDVEEPQAERVSVDFTPIFEETSSSDTVIFRGSHRRALSSMMISPNMVLESSRSSLDEPDVEGPASEDMQTPNLENAMGRPVRTYLSSQLLRYLDERNVTVVAPVMSFRWYSYACWKSAECRMGTWVERMLQMHRSYAQGAEEGGVQPEYHYPMGRPAGSRSSEVTTTAFGVRSLGVYFQNVHVSVDREGDGGDGFVVRPSPIQESSVCAQITVRLPVALFEGEILELQEGNMIARVREVATSRPEESLIQELVAFEHTEARATHYRQWSIFTGKPIPNSRYSYVSEWEPDPVLCDNVRKMIARYSNEITVNLDERALIDELIDAALAPLF